MKNLLCLAALLVLVGIDCPRAISEEKQAPPAPLERVKELLVSEKPIEALTVLEAYHPAPAELSTYHYSYARALVGLKKPFESITHYRLAYIYAATTADRERLLFERAEVYAAMEYYSESAVCYDVFLQQFPRSSYAERAELGIAEARRKNGELRQALEHYQKAGTAVRALIGKANVLQALGRTAEASVLYRNLLEHNPKAVSGSPETLLSIGDNFRLSGSPSDAKVYYESVKDPVLKYRASLGLGLVAMDEKRFDAAASAFLAAEESPDRAVRREAALNRADSYLRIGKYDAARSALEDIKTNYPYGRQYDTAVLLLARISRKESKFLEAATLLKSLVLRRNPVPAALDEIEAMMLVAADRDVDGLLKLWKEAGRWLLDPSRSASLVKIAGALRRSGKPFLDICTWLTRYGTDDAKAEGRFMLADFYADLGDASTAANYLRRAKIKGRSDAVARLRAKLALARGDAKGASEQIMAIRESTEADLVFLIDLLNGIRDAKKAVAFCEEALRKRPASIKTTVRFADALYNSGRAMQALAYYRAAVSASPEQARKDAAVQADREWAHYRIAALAQGADAAASLEAIQSTQSPLGRFAAARLRGDALRSRVE